MQSRKNQQSAEPMLPHQGYSNLIFNQQKRAICALSFPHSPPKAKHCSREHSIMLLKKSKRQNYSRDFGSERETKSVQIIANAYQNNKINVINLMSCSMSPNPKLKSNYCKKITLTNVDKYYEFCLKKMKAICSGEPTFLQRCEDRPLSSTRRSRPRTPFRNPNNAESHNQTSKLNSTNEVTNAAGSKQKDRNQSNMSLYEWKNLKGSYSKICPKHQHQMESPRNIYSSFNLREKSKGNRRYLNSNQHYRAKNSNERAKKSQFAIDAWESTDNVDEYIF